MTNKKYNSIVIKIGSSSLATAQGKLDVKNLKKIVRQVVELVKAKKQVVIVSSGAIVCGAEKLKLGKPKSMPEKQAAAAVGQSTLMRQYEKAFEKYGIHTGQVLLTKNTLNLNAKHCLNTLLKEKVVPIVNENDTVAVEEIKIGDNDNLAAQTACLLKSDLLVLLTDVDGFYLDKKVVPEIKEITKTIENAAGHAATQQGTGGMKTKIQAAKACIKAGIDVIIINGRKSKLISQAVAGKKVGTRFDS